jgi:hypothetical protein
MMIRPSVRQEAKLVIIRNLLNIEKFYIEEISNWKTTCSLTGANTGFVEYEIESVVAELDRLITQLKGEIDVEGETP